MRICVEFIVNKINLKTPYADKIEIYGILKDIKIDLNPKLKDETIYEIKNNCRFIKLCLSVKTKDKLVETSFYLSDIIETKDKDYYVKFNKKKILKIKFPNNYIKINRNNSLC